MFFRLPHPPLAFEIPDGWLEEAGASGFMAASPAYAHVGEASVVEVKLVAPMLRCPGVVRDCNGFRRDGFADNAAGGSPGGMVNVLRAIAHGIPLPPVELRRGKGKTREGFEFVMQNGFHRFYASVAMGFGCIPYVEVRDWRDGNQLGDS